MQEISIGSSMSQGILTICVALGVIMLWAKTSKAQRKVYGLSDLVSNLITHEKVRSFIELLIFVALGCTVSMLIISPSTRMQALAAGFGWTGLATR
jgi:hypothetical protein